MGYDGSWHVNSAHRYESKAQNIQNGLTYANAITATKGTTLSWQEFKKRVSKIDIGTKAWDLTSLLRTATNINNLFNPWDGTLDYILLMERETYYQTGMYAYIRAYPKHIDLEKHKSIQYGSTDDIIPEAEFNSLIKEAKYEFPCIYLGRTRTEQETITRQLLQCKNAIDALPIKHNFTKRIHDILSDPYIKDVNEFQLKLFDIIQNCDKTAESVTITYRNGHVILQIGTQKYSHKIPLYFDIEYLFMENPLSNTDTITDKKVLKTVIENLPYIQDGSTFVNKLLRNAINEKITDIAFYGSF